MIKVDDIKYVTYGVSDLDRTEAFLKDFGLVTASRDEARLYMRGTGSSPYIYVAELSSEPGFKSIALEVRTRSDLESAQEIAGASGVSRLEGPGGGLAVDLVMPGGVVLQLVHGIAEVPAIQTRRPLGMNAGSTKARFNTTQRPMFEPAQVLRLGHVALGVADAVAAGDWLKRNLGMLVSDTLLVPGTSQVLGHFMRCDRGMVPADHHTFLLANLPEHGAHHASFEVEDLDALQQGHRWLKAHGHESQWGVGRHLLGSQLFDYWWDPDGNRMEHYTDGDVFDNTVPSGQPVDATDEHLAIWGPDVPSTFFALRNAPAV